MLDICNMTKPNKGIVATFSNASSGVGAHLHCNNFSHPTRWLDALRSDDVETASTILQAASSNYKTFLMNGDIQTFRGTSQGKGYRNESSTSSGMEFSITKPFHAAAICHSHALLRLLLTSGGDVLHVDRWNNSVIHMLVYVTSKAKARGTKHEEILVYLQELFSVKTLKHVMIAENEFLLRPLEFAALHGCIGMVGAIMQTKCIYLIKEGRFGYNVVQ